MNAAMIHNRVVSSSLTGAIRRIFKCVFTLRDSGADETEMLAIYAGMDAEI
jgi:hypothetical protein